MEKLQKTKHGSRRSLLFSVLGSFTLQLCLARCSGRQLVTLHARKQRENHQRDKHTFAPISNTGSNNKSMQCGNGRIILSWRREILRHLTGGRPHLAGRLLMTPNVPQAQSLDTAPSAEQHSGPGAGGTCPGNGGTL